MRGRAQQPQQEEELGGEVARHGHLGVPGARTEAQFERNSMEKDRNHEQVLQSMKIMAYRREWSVRRRKLW
jgi:hypothetical protein